VRLLALVSDAFGGSGGIARYNRDLLTALAAGGVATVVLPREGRAEVGSLPPGIDQRPPRGRAGFTAAALLTAWRDGPFDAVFCGHINLAPAAAVAAALVRAPLWLQLHGVEAWAPQSPTRRWAAERAALVTAVSRHTRYRFLGLARVEPWRVRVLPNTVDDRFAPGPKPDFLLERHGLRGKTVLLTVGRLSAAEHGKGHDRVIAALPTLAATRPGIVYVIVGEGDDRPRLEAMARTLGVADRVLFAGAVADAELPDYYRVADAFVMPSVQEGFGIVLLEAAASGLPVVAGDIDGSADALADGALGRLVNPHDAPALARAIDQAIGAPPPQKALVARYGFASFARRAAELANELVSSAPPRKGTMMAATRPVGAG
jgi:phosphatidyl-myo-inositol dimannoside synthase